MYNRFSIHITHAVLLFTNDTLTDTQLADSIMG